MWALIIVMLLPTGQAVGEDEILVYPTQETCLWAGAERGPPFRDMIAEKAKVPPEAIKSVGSCTKLAGRDV